MPSISIVVGLMLVFRNQTAYSRFWEGRLHLNTITSSIRCLVRTILVLSPAPAPHRRLSAEAEVRPGIRRAATRSMPDIAFVHESSDQEERHEGERRTTEVVKILMAMMYTVKNHLRTDWGVALSPGTCVTSEGQETTDSAYLELLPANLRGFEHRGLALTLQLAVFVEAYIAMGSERNWFNNGSVAQMTAELNGLTKAYGDMEVIRLTPIPVAHLIHHQQTLAIYCTFLAFAMAYEMGWWTVPIVAFVSFTLYGIEGIASNFEDPFGKTRISIKMDEVVEDTRREVEVMLEVWQTQNHGRPDDGSAECKMFVPHPFAKRPEAERKRSSILKERGSVRELAARGPKDARHVRWNSLSSEEATEGSMSPRTKEQEALFGARRVTWGSEVGESDKGVFSMPVCFEGVGP